MHVSDAASAGGEVWHAVGVGWWLFGGAVIIDGGGREGMRGAVAGAAAAVADGLGVGG